MNLKNKISASFSNKAENYNENAVLQKIVAEKLIEFSETEIKNSANILDIGSGTGFVAQIIKDKFHKDITQSDISPEMCRVSSIYGKTICCDFDELPFKNNNFDMVISSCALQWSPDLEQTLSGFNSILKNPGRLSFSIFGERTFHELNSLCKKLNMNFPVNSFLNLEKIKKLLQNNGFKTIKSETELTTENISIKELFRKMQDIGANTNTDNRKLKKSDYKTLQDNYNDKTSWEIYYISAQK